MCFLYFSIQMPTFQIQCWLQASDENSSDDEEMGRPGGPRFSTDYDEAPRNCLDLLALNRLGGLGVMSGLIMTWSLSVLANFCNWNVMWMQELRSGIRWFSMIFQPMQPTTGLQILSSWSLPSKRWSLKRPLWNQSKMQNGLMWLWGQFLPPKKPHENPNLHQLQPGPGCWIQRWPQSCWFRAWILKVHHHSIEEDWLKPRINHWKWLLESLDHSTSLTGIRVMVNEKTL